MTMRKFAIVTKDLVRIDISFSETVPPEGVDKIINDIKAGHFEVYELKMAETLTPYTPDSNGNTDKEQTTP